MEPGRLPNQDGYKELSNGGGNGGGGRGNYYWHHNHHNDWTNAGDNSYAHHIGAQADNHEWRGRSWDQPSGPTHQLDRKDLEKPLKYAGNTTKWYGWAESFRRYLRRHDLLWPDILTKIEKMEGRVITKEDEDALRKE